MELKNFDQLVADLKGMEARRVMAVAGAGEAHVLEAVLDAKDQGLADAILVGDPGKVRELLRSMDRNPSDFAIEDVPAGMTPAEAAVELIKKGDANFLMKGLVETSDLLRPVVKKENGLRTGRTMSHLAFDSLPTYHKIIVSTDGGMVTYPDLQKKKELIVNAVETLRTIGYGLPKVAVLCCKETVDEKMPETLDARALKDACQAGQLGECYVEGPISYDLAMSREAAQIKKFDCPYSGDFDVLLGPNIHANNMLGKAWTVSCGATLAGVVVGARVPIVLTSRGSSALEKSLSIALAGTIAARSR